MDINHIYSRTSPALAAYTQELGQPSSTVSAESSGAFKQTLVSICVTVHFSPHAFSENESVGVRLSRAQTTQPPALATTTPGKLTFVLTQRQHKQADQTAPSELVGCPVTLSANRNHEAKESHLSRQQGKQESIYGALNHWIRFQPKMHGPKINTSRD